MNEWNRQWHVRHEMYRDAVDMLLVENRDGQRSYARAEMTIHPKKDYEIAEPTMSITPAEAQQIMDGLWVAGFRPRDGAGSLAHVEATKAHLEDLRRLVFEKPSPSDSPEKT